MSEPISECPCGSGRAYADCCEPTIRDLSQAETAEAVMRARYTAYVRGEIDFLQRSLRPDKRDDFDRDDVKRWSENADWQGLEIVETTDGGAGDDRGHVEFVARYSDASGLVEHHETAEFERDGATWFYVEGHFDNEPYVNDEPRIGRNEPCPCGSGKKYKKCCGRLQP